MKKLLTKKYASTALFGIIFGAVLYSMLMALQLTNTYDGLWQQNTHTAGTTELTSGRWLLQYVDAFTAGLHADPLLSLAALSLYTLGFLVILDLLGIQSKRVACLSLALFLSSAAICNTLSYRFTSLGYSLSFFLAVFGVYIAVKLRNPVCAVAVSGICIALSMACYQAYLAVFCILAVWYLLFRCAPPKIIRHPAFFPLFSVFSVRCSSAVFVIC